MERIAEKVGAWLLVSGNTKQLLSDKLGMSVGALNNRLSGETEWSWSEVCKLAEITGCSLSDFATKPEFGEPSFFGSPFCYGL